MVGSEEDLEGFISFFFDKIMGISSSDKLEYNNQVFLSINSCTTGQKFSRKRIVNNAKTWIIFYWYLAEYPPYQKMKKRKHLLKYRDPVLLTVSIDFTVKKMDPLIVVNSIVNRPFLSKRNLHEES